MMKKNILVFILLISLLFTLVGCAEKKKNDEPFSMESAIEELKDNGLTVYEECKTESELTLKSSTMTIDIFSFGGDFSIELAYYISLVQYSNTENECRFMEFVNEEQATQYAEYFMGARTQNGEWLVAHDGKVVVITNLSIAKDHINLKFK